MRHVAVVFFIAATGYAADNDWTYDNQQQWPGVCNTGLQQSPINIDTKSALLDAAGTHLRGPLVFRGYDSVNATAENDGHTLKWSIVDDDLRPTVSGGPLRGNYSFLQFHVHWLSEHAIDGMKYPLEIHLVHAKTGLTTDEAVLRPDGLAVIGIMCQVYSGEESEQALAELEPIIPKLVERGADSIDAVVYNLSRLFSPVPQSYFTYHGSLTTPLCQEAVTWIVMDKPLIISDDQYKLFRTVDVGGVDNYRNLQKLGSRLVYRSVASSSHVAIPGSLGFLATLINIKSLFTATMSKGICIFVNIKRKYLGNKLQECSIAE